MLIARIEGCTRVLGAPKGWNEGDHVPCAGLPILDTLDAAGDPIMQSAWQPTPDELARLNAGHSVILSVWGIGHPPVFVQVGGAP